MTYKRRLLIADENEIVERRVELSNEFVNSDMKNNKSLGVDDIENNFIYCNQI